MEQIVEDKLLLEMLLKALETLTEDERFLIDKIYFKEKSERDVAKKTNESNVSINKKHHKIIKKLKKLIK